MNIRSTWQSFFAEQVPISFLLRQTSAEVWLRIHSLPESKRYAEDETEMQEILRRHGIIAAEILGEADQCAFIFSDYDLKLLSPLVHEIASASPFYHYRDESEGFDINQYATGTVWGTHKFDPVLRLAANDQIHYVSWMNLESGELFAPYDGGSRPILELNDATDCVPSIRTGFPLTRQDFEER